MWTWAGGATLLGGLLLWPPVKLSPEVVIINALVLVLLCYRCISRMVFAGKGHVWHIAPSSIEKLGLLDSANVWMALLYAASSLTLLGTLQFFVIVSRLLPDLWQFRDAHAVGAQIMNAFPADLELNMTNGELFSSRKNRFNIDLPSWSWFDMCDGTWKLKLASLDFGSPDLYAVGRLLAIVYFNLSPSLQVTDVSVGEEVEVQVDSDLIDCGARRSWLPLPFKGKWVRAVVRSVQPSTLLSEFRYIVRVQDEWKACAADSMKELLPCGPGLFPNCSCAVSPTSLRRAQPRMVVLASEEDVLEDVSELRELRAEMIFARERFANLEGFSFHHGQFWRYRNIKASEMWRRYSLKELSAHGQLQCMTGLYCNSDGKKNLHCSRVAATANLKTWSKEFPHLAAVVQWNLHVPVLCMLLWLACVSATLLCRGFTLLALYLPAGYVSYALVRHVDTALLAPSVSLCMVLFTAMPFLYFSCVCETLPELWGHGEHLPPWLQTALSFEVQGGACSFWLWLAWSSYIVVRLRQRCCSQRHGQRIYAAQSGSTDVSEGTGDLDSGLPTCRICFGGTENGRLISPCLCSGTMRYVHLECLNMWRASSANPQSAYKCDQCNFQYSFQRALYASILRSALVLHSITLLLFAGTVLLCGYVCYYVDWLQNGDGTTEVLSQDLVDHFVNVSGLDDIDKEEFRRLADGLNSFTFGGISLAHILNGIMMVGLSGCVSSSIFFFGRLSMTDTTMLPLMLVVVIVGLLRVFYALYHFIKQFSGKVLASAESMILEIEGHAADGVLHRPDTQ